MGNLLCDFDVRPGGVVVSLSGQITYEEMAIFHGCADRLIAHKPAIAVLDLSELTFLSSAGIGALLQLHKRLKDAGSELRLAAPQQSVASMLELTRLDKIFPVFPSVDNALP